MPAAPFRRVLLVVLLATLAGCSALGPSPYRRTNKTHWIGELTSRGASYTFEFDITESGGIVSGSGSIDTRALQGRQVNFSISGNYSHPQLQLNLQFLDRPSVLLQGSMSADRNEIEGTLMGGGFNGENLRLRRD